MILAKYGKIWKAPGKPDYGDCKLTGSELLTLLRRNDRVRDSGLPPGMYPKAPLRRLLVPAVVLAAVLQLASLASAWASPPILLPNSPTETLPNLDSPGKADFNGDGLIDRGIVLQARGSTVIYLSLSREPRPRRIGLTERVAGVVAADIDRDGDTDLVALTRNFRVLVWLNDSRGKFSPRKSNPKRVPSKTSLEKQITQTAALFLWSDSRQDETKFLQAGSRPGEANLAELTARSTAPSARPVESECDSGCPPRGPPLEFFPS